MGATPAAAEPPAASVDLTQPVASVPESTEAFALGVNASTATAPGPGFYVDSISGDDANDGSFASPWKSLSKLVAVRLTAGQNIYLRCGSVWRESLTLTWTQLLDNTVIAGYGACGVSKATITGADSFTGGWTKSGNVWSRDVPAGTPKINRLFVNGQTIRLAQWPNYGGVGHEYAISHPSSPVSTTQLRVGASDLSTLAGKDMVGATVQVRADSHFIDARTIASFGTGDGTMGFVATETPNQMEGGDGYVLQDKLWMLDAPGEFFHDTVNNKLYVYPADSATQANLNAVSVEGSVRDMALQVVNRANLQIKNLALTRARVDGLFLNEVPSATVKYVDASENGRSGVQIKLGTAPAAPARGATVSNSTFLNNWVYGIYGTYGINADILSNHTKDIGTIGYAGAPQAGIAGGIGARIEGNDVRRVGFNGITFSGTGGTSIINNDIAEYCLRLSDCAAVYTWNGPNATSHATNQSSLIENNRIASAAPNMEGAVGGASDIVVGIYLDDYSRGSTVRNNILYGMPMGIYIHNGSNHTISSNKVWLTSRTALWANMNMTDADYMTGNLFSNNQLAPVGTATGTYPALPTFSSSHAIWFKNNKIGFASLAPGLNLFSQNQIVHLNGSGRESAWVRSATESLYLTANGWKSMNLSEGGAVANSTFAAYSTSVGSELTTGGGFDSSISPWGARVDVPQLGSISYAGGQSACTGNCVLYTASSVNDMLNSPGFSIDASLPHVLRYQAGYSGTARLRPWIGRNLSPWDSLVLNDLYVTFNDQTGSAGDTIQQELFFQPKTSTVARANIQMTTYGVPTTVDSVSVRPLLGYTLAKPADWVTVLTAPRDAPRTVACGDMGWPSTCKVADINGNAVSLPTTLTTGTGMLFTRTDSPWKR